MSKSLYFLTRYNSFNLLLLNILINQAPIIASPYALLLLTLYIQQKRQLQLFWLIVLTLIVQTRFSWQQSRPLFINLNQVQEVIVVLTADTMPNALGYATVTGYSQRLINDQWQIFDRLDLRISFSNLTQPLYRGAILHLHILNQESTIHYWHIRVNANQLTSHGYSHHHWRWRSQAISTIIAYIQKRLGWQGGLLLAILIGNQSLLSPYLIQLFRQSGVAHYLALSGLHASFFVFLIHLLLVKSSPKFKFIVLTLFILLHLWLSGFPYTLMRAYWMALLFLYAYNTYQAAKLLDVLGLSSLLILLVDLKALTSLSFQLSFLSMLGIALFYTRINHLLHRLSPYSLGKIGNRIKDYVFSNLALTLAVTLVINPLLLFHFNQVALFSALTNILLPPLLISHLLVSTIALLLGGVMVTLLGSFEQLLYWLLQLLNLYQWQAPWQVVTILHVALALSVIFWHNKLDEHATKL